MKSAEDIRTEISEAPAKKTSAWSNLLLLGTSGSAPVVIGLVLIAVVFQFGNSNFLTPLNITNLMVQISAVGTISVGIVLVLLLGEIDLSVGAVSGLCASVMAVLSAKSGQPAVVAVGAGILVGTAIGLLQGFWFAKLRVPSFVVTLAGLLGWQGAQLYVLGSTGTINLTDPLITGIANTRLSVSLGWILALLFVGVYAVTTITERRLRQQAGLEVASFSNMVFRIALVAAGVLVVTGIMSVDRSPAGFNPIQGLPSAVPIFIGFIVLFDFITKRTTFGRYIFAVGGNAEAARRGGINVDGIRIAVFALASTLAACGGIMAGSRLLAVNQSSGGGDILLNSIAAAVIGGTSLFGGRGSAWSALLGALVIGSIANGMDLLALPSSIRFMVTGAVLLIAVTLDAYSRSLRQKSGRV